MRDLARLFNAATLALFLSVPLAATSLADEVGRFSNDWTGNDLVVEAVADPKIEGVTCHLVRFDRSVIDRLRQGNWFEDPSNASIACRQTGAIKVGDIDFGSKGEEVFSDRISLIFKALAIRRIYDRKNETLVYVIYSRQVVEGSAKMAISTVPLRGNEVTWTKRPPS